MVFEFDAVVVGGGHAGYEANARFAQERIEGSNDNT